MTNDGEGKEATAVQFDLSPEDDRKDSAGTEGTVLESEVTEDDESYAEEEPEAGPPDEKNRAPILNVGNVFLVLILAVGVTAGLVTLFSSPSKKKAQEDGTLDKAGAKYIPSFAVRNESRTGGMPDEEETEKNEEEIIAGLPETFRFPEPEPQPPPSQAPAGVAPVGSRGGGTGPSRPDTRNSNSVRRPDGMGGVNEQSRRNNAEIAAAALAGRETPSYGGQSGYASEYAAAMAERQNMLTEQMRAMMSANASTGMPAGAQSNKESFFASGANNGGNGNWMSFVSLWDGTIIPGALVTAINTDNPGVVIARVTENVYSSYDASFLLIPEGSLLYATYNSSVSYGQNKVQVAWNLLIRPDGYRVQLGNMNGVDAQGASGYKGNVSNHPFETLKALGLVAVWSVIQTEMYQEMEAAGNIFLENAMADTFSEVSRLGSKIIDRALDIKPTITIPAGTEIKLITNMPLELPPVKVHDVTRKYVRTR